MSALVIIRGLPGSGKSSFAELLSEQGKYPCISIDDYFTDENGHYEFNHKENFKAYQYSVDRTEQAMQNRSEKILVHNVFSMYWEMKPYFDLAKTYAYKVFVITVEKHHDGRNTHGVSEDQLEKMAEKFVVKLK